MGDHEYQAPAQYNPPQIQHVQVQNHQQVNSVQYPSLGPPGPGPQGPQAQFVGQVQEPVAVQQQPQQVVYQPQPQHAQPVQQQHHQQPVTANQLHQPPPPPPPQQQQQTMYVIQQPPHQQVQQPVQVQQQRYQYPPQHQHHQQGPQQHYQQGPPQQQRPVYHHQPQYVNVVQQAPPQQVHGGQPPPQGQRVYHIQRIQGPGRPVYSGGRPMAPHNQGQGPPPRQMIVLRPANPHPGQQVPQHRVQGPPRPGPPGQPPQNVQRMHTMQLRPIHNQGPPRQQIRIVHQQGPPGQPRPQQQPRIISQYHQRPPPPQHIPVQGQPPPPGQHAGGQQGEVMLNVEHHFMDNGKVVKKMPIEMGGQIIWVDCADEEQLPKEDHLVLDFETNNSPGAGSAGTPGNLPNPVGSSVQSTKRGAKDFSESEKAAIISECIDELYSPTMLAEKYNVNVTAIRGWIKSAGKQLPQKYKFNATGTGKSSTSGNKPPTPSSAQSMSPALDSNAPNQTANPNNSLLTNVPTSNSDDTITLYAGGQSNENSRSGSDSPPQQVVRHPQLLVTDNKGQGDGQVPGSGPNQLQLPQRPTPPNLPKPVPSRPAEPYKPKIIPGKVAVCGNCGGYSIDLAKCTGCRKPIKEGAKIMPDPDYKPPPGEHGPNKKGAAFAHQLGGDLRSIRLQPKPGRRKTNSDEPECIALSSDEDEGDDEENEDGTGDKNSASVANGEISEESKDDSSNNETGENAASNARLGEGKSEEVCEFNPGPASINEPRITSMISNLQSLLKGNSTQQFTTLTCRSIRVGSYKILTKEKVFFTEKAIYLKVPFLTDITKQVTIVIPVPDILKIEMLSGRSMPLLFISTMPSTCDRVRRDLNLNFKTSGLYFDLSSNDETMKRITMLPEKMPDEVKNMLTQFYGDVISELDNKSANEMLVRSTPKTSAISQQQQLQKSCGTGMDSSSSGPRKEPSFNSISAKVEKYCQYPPTGTNTVSVTMEDYYCLEDESFLNDVIIDFYFKWIQHTIIPAEARENTHVFTTYFYKRLTTRPARSKNKLHPIEDDVNLSAAEKRYDRVRRWTKKVNIFEKDFVIVPINEHSHWFVAVICYPGLVGKRRMDNNEVIPEVEDLDKSKQDEKAEKLKAAKKKVMQIGSTSIIPLKSSSNNFHMDDDSDKDEAEASDSEMVVEDPEEDKKIEAKKLSNPSSRGSSPPKTPLKEEMSPKTDPNAVDSNSSESNEPESEADKMLKEMASELEVKKDLASCLLAPSPSNEETSGEKSIESSMDNQEKSETNPVTEDSDNKEALAKNDNEPTTTSSTEEKAELTNSEAKPDSPPKSPDQSQGKPEEEENSESIQNYVAIKQPCILIFDSLQTGLRSRVVATLREYLQCEYKAKMQEDREFNKDTMKGACPKVPQQPNFSDCGLFALQYVESFFKSPIADYQLPVKGLKKWFPSEVMRNKRSEIAKIIRDLAVEQNKDPSKTFDFPTLTFTPETGSGYTDDEGDNEIKPATSKVLMKPTNRFMVKSNTPPTTTTRVICLTSSKSLTLTPSKSNSSGANNSGAPLMIQRKKGKIEYFTLGANKNQNSSANAPKKSGTTPKKLPTGVKTVLIPKLTGGPGQKMVKKDMSNKEMDPRQNAAASSSGDGSSTVNNTSLSKSLVANYSDNSNNSSPDNSEDQDSNKTSPVGVATAALEMEVDEDGAPLPSATPMLKRPSPDSTSNEELDSAKKAKVDVEDQATDHNAALVTSSNDA